MIGVGSFSKVYLVKMEGNTYAMKVISKIKLIAESSYNSQYMLKQIESKNIIIIFF